MYENAFWLMFSKLASIIIPTRTYPNPRLSQIHVLIQIGHGSVNDAPSRSYVISDQRRLLKDPESVLSYLL